MMISDYYLDMEKVFSLEKEQSSTIIDFYNRMLDYSTMHNSGQTSLSEVSIFNTLLKSGYLKNKFEEERNEKLGDLING